MCSIDSFIGIIQAVGAIQSATAASAAANAQAQQAEQQARISAIRADQEFRAGVSQEKVHRSELKRINAENTAAAAAAGTVPGAGSSLDAALANINASEQDASMIKYNAANNAWGHEAQAVQYQNQASIHRAEASNASSAGFLSAFGTILGAAGNIFGDSLGKKLFSPAQNQNTWTPKNPIAYGWTDPRKYPQYQYKLR